jgi:hypothetical protein
MDYDGAEVDRIRRPLYQRIRRFAGLTINDELRTFMWRLGEVVGDRDCPNDINEDCKALFGLVGDRLKERLVPLLTEYESRVLRLRESRERIEALRITKEMSVSDQLREFYFNLSESDLQAVWNNGDNDLSASERKLVRIALRNKLGIRPTQGPLLQLCSKCHLVKDACTCEKGGR